MKRTTIEGLRFIDFTNYTDLTNITGLREMKLRLKPTKMIIPWVFDY